MNQATIFVVFTIFSIQAMEQSLTLSYDAGLDDIVTSTVISQEASRLDILPIDLTESASPSSASIEQNYEQMVPFGAAEEQAANAIRDGKYHLRSGDREAALMCFEQAARSGNKRLKALAEAYIGEIYYGYGGAEYLTAAFAFFNSAVDQNDNLWAKAHAAFFLGSMYFDGKAIQADYEKALKSYELAANQDVNEWARAQALFCLAQMYFFGRGVPENITLAIDYLTQVALQNDACDLQQRAHYVLQFIMEKCPICLDKKLEDWIELSCNHKFHAACIETWFNENRNCPICRNENV